MKRALTAALLLALAVPLTACTAQSAAPAATEAVVESPASGGTASGSATEDAAAYYLAAICPVNDAIDANSAALDSGNLEDVVGTAIVARDASEEAADLLRDAPVVWPADVIEDLPLVADSFARDVAPFDEMSRAATIEEAEAVAFPDITEAIEASLRIRAVLGLPEDTAKGC